MFMLKGIDISMHNGTVDFVKVKNAGYKVVIINYIGSEDNQ